MNWILIIHPVFGLHGGFYTQHVSIQAGPMTDGVQVSEQPLLQLHP